MNGDGIGMGIGRGRVIAFRYRMAVALVGACMVVPACAPKRAAAPDPDAVVAPPPVLSGLTVMILPAQAPPRGSSVIAGVEEPVPGLDTEIGYFLAEQASRVHWITSDVVRKSAANARSLNIHPEALAVSAFHASRVKRIGDPLWGDLRLLGELMNARYAILPFAAGFARDSTGTQGRVEIGAALIDTGNGNVLWTGYAAGDRGPQDSRAVVASAARALARKIAP
jgi:hypothetical protein